MHSSLPNVNPQTVQHFGKTRYNFAGCMNFSISDHRKDEELVRKSQKYLEFSPSGIFKQIHSPNDSKSLKKGRNQSPNLCSVCMYYGSSTCPFSQEHIEREYLQFNQKHQKCAMCKGKFKNFHGYLYSPHQPELICLTCYQAMAKGVLFQYLRKIQLRFVAYIYILLALTFLSLILSILRFFQTFFPSIEGFLLLLFGILVVVILGCSIAFHFFKKHFLASAKKTAERYGYQEFNTNTYPLRDLAKMIVNPSNYSQL